ncbi:MAG: triose-phosphate isomerase [Erysipelotrichaceae bacterium]|nr:triose-phosphate isomerase [Erysipelotrichaceae bacterium]
MKQKKFKLPFLVVNPKNYLYDSRSLRLAQKCDQVAKETGITIFFTCPYTDIRLIKENTENLIVTAQSMDSLVPGRGVGRVLPEAIKNAGAGAVFLNHEENPKTVSELCKAIQRAKRLGIITLVCADSVLESKAIAVMGPDIIIAEPSDLIGTGKLADDAYNIAACQAIKEANPDVSPMIAAGVSTAEDCYNIVKLGSDGTGGTTGILNAPDHLTQVRAWADAIMEAYNERMQNGVPAVEEKPAEKAPKAEKKK